MKNNFTIEKWYMDCIDDQGNAFIGYAAMLSWGKLTLNYSGQIHYSKENGVVEKSTLRKTKFPIFDDKHLNWQVDYTQSTGKWESLAPSIYNPLLISEKGNIDWFCAQPKAAAEVLSLNNFAITGLGYTEKLTISIKPWELPIDELRWGRFLSGSHSVVWIDWRGPKPLSLVYVNGKLIKDAEIEDFSIQSKNEKLKLTLHDSITIRKGSLITTALSKFPWMKKVFPDKILTTFECKWRSRGSLRINDLIITEGWSIHELVKWN